MKVIWTPEANNDRLEIQNYIATDNPKAAANMDRLFLHAAARLRSFPMLGQKGKVAGTRELVPHENYRLIYEVASAENTVWILALVHAARQWPLE